MKKSKKILILGGSSDIGIEVVKIFLKLDWKVYAHFSKNKKILENLRTKNERLKIIKYDFSKYKNKNFEKSLKKKFSNNYSSFINLIGYTDNKSFYTTSLENIIKTLTINTIIPIIIQKLIINRMIRNKWGRILNCSGIGVKYGGGKNNFNYSLSQHTREFIPSVYKNWAEENVLINNMRIGVTDTKLHKRIKKNMNERVKLIPIKRMATPKEIATYIVKLVTEENSYITGQTISVSGGE